MTDHINEISKTEQTDKQNQARLLVKCPDRPGIVAALSKFLFDHDANIIESSQYTTDPEDGTFFIRIEFYCKNLLEKREQMKKDFEQLASEFTIDRKSTRLNSSHVAISYAVFCLKKKKTTIQDTHTRKT